MFLLFMTCFVDRLEYFLKTTGSKLSLNATFFFFQNKMWLTYILTSTFFIFCILPLAFCNYVMHLNHQLFTQKYLVLFTNLFCDMIKSLFLEKSKEDKYLSHFSLKKLASDWLAELIDQSGAQLLVGKCLDICPPSMPFSNKHEMNFIPNKHEL